MIDSVAGAVVRPMPKPKQRRIAMPIATDPMSVSDA